MKRRALVGVWCALLVVAPALAEGAAARVAPPEKTYSPADKFVRGLVNIVTAPLELPRRFHQRTHGDNTVRGWAIGTTQGLGFAVTRLCAGAYEVLTFPVPAPRRYAPVIEPEYVWDADEPAPSPQR